MGASFVPKVIKDVKDEKLHKVCCVSAVLILLINYSECPDNELTQLKTCCPLKSAKVKSSFLYY